MLLYVSSTMPVNDSDTSCVLRNAMILSYWLIVPSGHKSHETGFGHTSSIMMFGSEPTFQSGVLVGVGVFVGATVAVAVYVGLGVGVLVAVGVGVGVLYAPGVHVGVGVNVGVRVGVLVAVGVRVGVLVAVGVGVAVFGGVGVRVGVGVAVGGTVLSVRITRYGASASEMLSMLLK